MGVNPMRSDTGASTAAHTKSTARRRSSLLSLNADMGAADFAASLLRLDLSRVQAADLFKVSYRSISNWLVGSQPVPTSVAMALRLMVEGGVKARDLIALDGPSALEKGG
jgi:hypothetical protein